MTRRAALRWARPVFFSARRSYRHFHRERPRKLQDQVATVSQWFFFINTEISSTEPPAPAAITSIRTDKHTPSDQWICGIRADPARQCPPDARFANRRRPAIRGRNGPALCAARPERRRGRDASPPTLLARADRYELMTNKPRALATANVKAFPAPSRSPLAPGHLVQRCLRSGLAAEGSRGGATPPSASGAGGVGRLRAAAPARSALGAPRPRRRPPSPLPRPFPPPRRSRRLPARLPPVSCRPPRVRFVVRVRAGRLRASLIAAGLRRLRRFAPRRRTGGCAPHRSRPSSPNPLLAALAAPRARVEQSRLARHADAPSARLLSLRGAVPSPRAPLPYVSSRRGSFYFVAHPSRVSARLLSSPPAALAATVRRLRAWVSARSDRSATRRGKKEAGRARPVCQRTLSERARPFFPLLALD